MASRVRILVPVAVVVLILGAGLFWSARGDGPSAGGTPTATAIPTVAGARGTATESATTAVPAGDARDLAADEARGGHTLARHVGKSDAELRDRLRDEPEISAASTYADRATAERTVGEVLRREQAAIARWAARADHPNLVLRGRMAGTVGRSLRDGAGSPRDVRSAVVVLRWSGDGWYVLTSYPEGP